MDKYEKETEKILLDHEKEAYNKLKNTYATALKDIKLRIRDLKGDIELLKMTEGEEDENNLIRSKIYQLNYQKALESQIGAILEVVKQDNVKTTQSFLTKMYEDSFLSINYNLQRKGIPLLLPINNKMIVDVINTPTDKLKFSQRLYKQLDELKEVVKAEISRGIATGKGYGEIAKQVARQTEADFNKSYRIARTEGGRVSSESKLQAMKEAKNRGADIVKQWDATLDNLTRPVHQQLDGQYVEIDEYFKAGGYKVQRPHGFGVASQDVNCRCVLLSVPRWDLEDEVEKRDNISGEIIKAKNYSDWKEKYYKVVKDVTTNTMTNKGLYTSVKECFSSFSLNGIEKEYAKDIENRLLDLQNTYPINKNIDISARSGRGVFGYNKNGIGTTKQGGKTYVIYKHNINFSNTYMFEKAYSLARHLSTFKLRGSKLVNDTLGLTTVDHEYAHAIDTYYLLKVRPDLREIANKYSTKQTFTVSDISVINKFNSEIHNNENQLSNVIFNKMKANRGYTKDYELYRDIKSELGTYATESKKEFLAEGFSNMRNLKEEEKTEFIKEFENIFNEEFGRVILNGNNK